MQPVLGVLRVRNFDEEQPLHFGRRDDQALLIARFVRILRVLDVPENLRPEQRQRVGVIAVDGHVRYACSHAVKVPGDAPPVT